MSDDELDRLVARHASLSMTIRRTMFVLLSYATFCLVTIAQPGDIGFFKTTEGVTLPLANVRVGLDGFLIAGPIGLWAITLYLHIFLRQLRRLPPIPADRKEQTLFNFDDGLARGLGHAIFYFVPPAMAVAFAWETSAGPMGYYPYALAAIPVGVFLFAVRREFPGHNPYGQVVYVCAAFVLAVGLSFAIHQGSGLIRPLNLADADLSNLRLDNASLRHADLSNANLKEASLDSADLSHALLFQAELSGAQLQYADFIEADLNEADFTEADLSNAVFSRARFFDTNLERAVLQYADFSGAEFTLANLEGADLSDAVAVGTNFGIFTDLDGAILKNADLHLSDFAFTFLIGADLTGANLKSADFDGADLIDAVLADADLTGATLVGADLTGADLTVTNLTDADLTDATVERVQLFSAILCRTTMPSGTVRDRNCLPEVDFEIPTGDEAENGPDDEVEDQ